jgi:C4-dicarboxylate-specific signal transduction histidine kinase
LRDSEYRELELLAASTASRLDQLKTGTQRIVVQVSSERRVVEFLGTAATPQQATLRRSAFQVLQNVFRSNPDFDAVFLLDAQGNCLLSTDPQFVGKSYAFREYFREAMQGRSYISGILVGQTTGRPGLFLSNPVQSPDGRIVGVAVLKIKGEDIWQIVNSLRAGSESYAFLIDQQGVIISHPDRAFLYKSLVPLPSDVLQRIEADKRYGQNSVTSLGLAELQPMVAAQKPGHALYHSPLNQEPQIVGFAPLTVQPWVLAVSQPEPEFVAPLNHLMWENKRSVVVIGGLATAIALLLARSISRPIRSLTAASQALEQNQFDPHSLAEVARTEDDMGRLVRVFLKMAEEVQAREQRLKQQVIALRIEIDQTKRANHVAEITENEHFEQLQQKIRRLREQAEMPTEAEYFESLQSKVRSLKQRSPDAQKGAAHNNQLEGGGTNGVG